MSEIKSKSPKTVKVELLVPYGLIAIAITLFAGFVLGWNFRGDAEVQTKAAAKEMVTSLVPKEQK